MGDPAGDASRHPLPPHARSGKGLAAVDLLRTLGPLAGTRITFSFAAGTASGNAGCNTFRAPYSTQGTSLKVGPAITTRMLCAEKLMVQEREFLAALESAVTWSVEGGMLDMHRDDKERAIFANVKK